MEVFMTSIKAARLLGINKMTLHRWEKLGKIKAVRRNTLTGHRIYDLEYIEYVKSVIENNY